MCLIFLIGTGMSVNHANDKNDKVVDQSAESADMDVLYMSSMSSGNNYEVHVVIALNNYKNIDETEIRREVLSRCEQNNFHSYRFSKSLNEIDQLDIDVYQNKNSYKNGKLLFSFAYPEVENENVE